MGCRGLNVLDSPQYRWPGCPPLAPRALLGTRNQDRNSVSPPLSQYPKKFLKIPLKEKLKGCGPLPTPHSPFRHFCPIHAPNREEPLIFSPVLFLSLFDMTKYSFRKDLASINSCITAMGQEGTESRQGLLGSQEPLVPLARILCQGTPIVELASGQRLKA